MMDDFRARREQVGQYLEVLANAEKGLRRGKQTLQRVSRVNVLRAGTFLILYNVVEASARELVEGIHDQIVGRKVPFQELRDSIRREVVKGFKVRCDPDAHMNMSNVPLELVEVALGLEAGMPFSGNVDSKKIREVAAIYGFETSTDARLRNGADLLVIKTARNDLAHGNKTFEEVGRQYTTGDVLDLSARSIDYLEAILIGVGTFLREEGYLRVVTPAV